MLQSVAVEIEKISILCSPQPQSLWPANGLTLGLGISGSTPISVFRFSMKHLKTFLFRPLHFGFSYRHDPGTLISCDGRSISPEQRRWNCWVSSGYFRKLIFLKATEYIRRRSWIMKEGEVSLDSYLLCGSKATSELMCDHMRCLFSTEVIR